MLSIEIKKAEFFDEKLQSFNTIEGAKLELEHSLISVSKWESKWHKPFISKTKMSRQQMIDYIRCMTLNRNVDPRVYYGISNKEMAKIRDYINNPMTATWFSQKKDDPNKKQQVITSQIIYYWMVSFQIPFQCEKWHLNRLLTLIRVCGVKNQAQGKMSKSELAKRNSALNAQRLGRT